MDSQSGGKDRAKAETFIAQRHREKFRFYALITCLFRAGHLGDSRLLLGAQAPCFSVPFRAALRIFPPSFRPHTMANVVTHPHLQVGFHPGPVGHSPSPLGFGFGLTQPSMMQGWPTAPHAQPPSWGFPPQNTQPPTRLAKRRHEPEDEDRDERMDRSPTPERPKRAVPKRARTTPAATTTIGKEQQTSKENKPPTASDESDVDVGFLLGE